MSGGDIIHSSLLYQHTIPLPPSLRRGVPFFLPNGQTDSTGEGECDQLLVVAILLDHHTHRHPPPKQTIKAHYTIRLIKRQNLQTESLILYWVLLILSKTLSIRITYCKKALSVICLFILCHCWTYPLSPYGAHIPYIQSHVCTVHILCEYKEELSSVVYLRSLSHNSHTSRSGLLFPHLHINTCKSNPHCTRSLIIGTLEKKINGPKGSHWYFSSPFFLLVLPIVELRALL